MNVTDFGERNAARPSQQNTPTELRLARQYVSRQAPDLLDMLFGVGGAR